MNQPWKVIVVFVGVFLAGVICGGPLAGWLRERHHENRPPFAERTMRRFERELKLTDSQKVKIEPILLRAQNDWKEFRQQNVRNLTGVVERMHVELLAELEPEQRVKLEDIRKEFRARAEQFRGRVINRDRPNERPASAP